eukprot:scaffold6566_cov49-Attheya_sp.AAC.2
MKLVSCEATRLTLGYHSPAIGGEDDISNVSNGELGITSTRELYRRVRRCPTRVHQYYDNFLCNLTAAVISVLYHTSTPSNAPIAGEW